MSDRQSKWPEREILYLALTRPALTYGVPVEAFWVNVFGVFILGAYLSGPSIWRCPLLFWLMAIPVHLLMRELTALDYHWCRMLRLRLLCNHGGEWLDCLAHPVRSWRDTYSSA